MRLLLLLLPLLILLLLYLDGQRYDSDLLAFKHAPARSPFPDQLAGMTRAGQVRRYAKDTLYEYINGHAEYFIGAGFRGLTVAEYGAAEAGPALVINLYDLGNGLNAFGVLMNEAGQQSPAEVGTLGFQDGQGVSFIRGPYYTQVSLFDPALDGVEVSRAVDRVLRQDLADRPDAGDLAFRFPAFGEPLATHFVREYYRGMDFLNQVLERRFGYQDAEFDAFQLAPTAAGAPDVDAVVQALTGFLDDDGIEYRAVERNGLRFYRAIDPYEGDWFFVPLPQTLLGAYTALDDRLMQAVADFAGTEPVADAKVPGGPESSVIEER